MDSSLIIRRCDVGLGVFAGRRFAPGDHILTFRGPRVERDDPLHRSPRGGNLLQTGRRTYIDPALPAVLVNHSCNPNAGLVRNRRLVAIREIPSGREIRFDYSTTMDDGLWRMDCRCGEPSCRRVVTDFGELPPEVRDRYLALGIVSGFIAGRYRRRASAVA